MIEIEKFNHVPVVCDRFGSVVKYGRWIDLQRRTAKEAP